MPARCPSLSFIIPSRFHPGWSLLGRALHRFTQGDRLRAEAFHLVALTAGALAWLMGAYAAEALTEALAPAAPGVVWGILGAAGLCLVLTGLVGFRPRTVVTCRAAAVHVKRGREHLRLPYAALAETETVAPRVYHRHHRRYAAVRPFLDAPGTPVLLLHRQDGLVAALGLCEADRQSLLGHVERQEQAAPAALAARP